MMYVYSISCPDTGKVVYIGQTDNHNVRFINHINNKTSNVGKWIQNLKSNDKTPVFHILKRCYHFYVCNEYESKFIAHYNRLGQLFNINKTCYYNPNNNNPVNKKMLDLINKRKLFIIKTK